MLARCVANSFEQCIDNGVGVFILHDRDDQLFHPIPPQNMRVVAGCRIGSCATAARSWAGAKADEAGRPPGEEG